MRVIWRLALTLGVLAAIAEAATPQPAQIVLLLALVLVLVALVRLADLGGER